MARKYCYWNKEKYNKRHEHHPLDCKRISRMQEKKGEGRCVDMDRAWCLKNDCSIFDCNKNKWNSRKANIRKNIQRLSLTHRNIISVLEDAEDLNLEDLSDVNVYKFYRDLWEAYTRWQPLQNGNTEIEWFYNQEYGG